MSNIYVLTAKMKSSLETRFGKTLVCFRCGKELLEGDEIVKIRHRFGNGNHAKRYHKRCFEELLF